MARSWAELFTPTVAETYRFYAGLADSFEFEERHRPSDGQGAGLLVHEPVGVVGAIVPWNSALAPDRAEDRAGAARRLYRRHQVLA